MKPPDLEVLDRNLALLLTRCYEPARPSAAFRSGLRAEVDAALERRATNAIPSQRWLRPSLALPLAAAAAVVAFLAWPREEALPSLQELLVDGAVAWRTAPTERWRAWDGTATIVSERHLELATPSGRALALTLGDEDSLELGPDSRAVATRALDEQRGFELLAGRLALERSDGPTPWTVRAGAASAELETGRLEVELVSDTLEAGWLLHRGRARVRADGEWFELVPGAPWRPGDAPPSEPEPVARRPEAPPERSEVRPAAPIAPPEPEPVTSTLAAFTLEVVDAEGGAPVTEFEVCFVENTSLLDVRDPVVYRVTDASDGRARFGDLPPGSYSVDVAAQGFAFWRSATVELSAGSTTPLRAELRPGLFVRGLVLDPDGHPLAGAVVLSEAEAPPQPLAMAVVDFEGVIARRATTDANGRFELGPLAPGEHVLRASHTEYACGWSRRLDVSAGAPPDPVEIRVTRGGTLVGRIADEADEPRPGVHVIASLSDISGARLVMSYSGATSDADGQYRVERLVAGHYAVLCWGPQEEYDESVQPEFRLVEVRDGQTVEVDFAPELRGAAVRGRVTTRLGAPVSRMGLSMLPLVDGQWDDSLQKFAMSDGSGAFAFEEIDPGLWAFYVTPDAGSTIVQVDQVQIGRVASLEHDLVLPDGSVEGLVVDGRTGEPLRNAFVALFGLDDPFEEGEFMARQITREDGRFRFPHVAEGFYRLSAQSTIENYGHVTLTEILPRADGEPLRLELLPGGTIELEVLDAEGRPIGDAEVTFLDADGVPVSFGLHQETSASGSLLARGARPGTWTLVVRAAGRAEARTVVQVEAEATARVQVELGQATQD